jgi:hypothetical protein
MDYKWFLLNLILGGFVLWSYVKFLPGLPESKLWVGIDKPLYRYGYVLSMIFSAIGYILFLTKTRQFKKKKSIIALVFFLVSSALWAPFLSSSYSTQCYNVLCLTVTSVSVFILWKWETQPLARLGLLYLLFHVFVLDNLIWGGQFVRLHCRS